MKCHEIGSLLDGIDASKRTPAQRRAIEAHLAVCRACREGWAACEELAARPVPQMPIGLGARLAEALEASALEHARHARRRRIILGAGLAVVGAAVAGGIAWRSDVPAPEVAPAAASSAAFDAAARALADPAPADESAAREARISAREDTRQQDAAQPAEAALDPNSIVVLPSPNVNADPRFAAVLQQFCEELVSRLGTIDGLTVVSPERVQPFIGSRLPEEEIARQLGAGTVLVVRVSTDTRPVTVGALLVDGATGDSHGGTTGVLREPITPADVRDHVQNTVELIRVSRAQSHTDLETYLAETRATILNVALSDTVRAEALQRLALRPLEAHDDAIVAAAIELATANAGVRAYVWGAMRGVGHAYLVEPLLQSLAFDTDPYVRRMAAGTLGDFRDQLRVQTALKQAQANDESEAVREAAKLALLSDQERDELALATLLDETVPADERLTAVHVMHGWTAHQVPLTAEASRAVFDIGRESNDAEIRAIAWSTLARQRIHDPAFAGTLLHDLARHGSESVREEAARALEPYLDDPAVRAALEQAENDPSAEVRRAARRVLGQADP